MASDVDTECHSQRICEFSTPTREVALPNGNDELERAISVFSERSLRHGDGPVGRADVRSPVEHRLYRATAYEVFSLGDQDKRIPVDLG